MFLATTKIFNYSSFYDLRVLKFTCEEIIIWPFFVKTKIVTEASLWKCFSNTFSSNTSSAKHSMLLETQTTLKKISIEIQFRIMLDIQFYHWFGKIHPSQKIGYNRENCCHINYCTTSMLQVSLMLKILYHKK